MSKSAWVKTTKIRTAKFRKPGPCASKLLGKTNPIRLLMLEDPQRAQIPQPEAGSRKLEAGSWKLEAPKL
jgi:hypothetical protein